MWTCVENELGLIDWFIIIINLFG